MFMAAGLSVPRYNPMDVRMDVRTGVPMEMSALGGGAAGDWVADAGWAI